ncbi:hypothetical protein [Streptomyces sp. NPDC001741]|uniref:hypothetical protein n=1 Tax=unclassified Streptomyces TaxID=2593676 RepID=UPI003688112B
MSVKPVPQGYTTVTPWIISRDTAQLIAYMKRAFDAEELARLTGEWKRRACGGTNRRLGGDVVRRAAGVAADPRLPPLTTADLHAFAADMARHAGAGQLRSEGAHAVHDVPGRRQGATPAEAAARFSFT